MRPHKKPILKGQMFIIGSIILLLGIILVKDAINIYPVINEKTYQDSIFDDKNMRNVKNEYDFILGMTALDNKTQYLSDFSNYIRNDNYKIFYIASLVNGTTNNYTVTIGNYFGGNINYTLNTTSSTPEGYSGLLKDKTNISYFFNTSTLTSSVLITFNYTLDGSNSIEIIPIEMNKNFIQGFFDIKRDSMIYIRTKHTYNWSW